MWPRRSNAPMFVVASIGEGGTLTMRRRPNIPLTGRWRPLATALLLFGGIDPKMRRLA
jgi:hypothetical protein